MSLENVPSAIPDVLNYTKILPLSVESRARRRSYLPENGQSFVSDQNNIIRIPVSANAFLDTKESYLRMRLLNTTGLTVELKIEVYFEIFIFFLPYMLTLITSLPMVPLTDIILSYDNIFKLDSFFR